ncbi:MAG: M56 family metallopeptidase [Eubacteriales bacterium]|nr:M56 family metallopeptidase [Eubacteriales bacterium]
MILYGCMTIAGSIPVLICFVLWAVQRKNYNFRLGKKLLLIGMFFYLVPFQAVKYMLPEKAVSALTIPTDINVEQDFYKIISVKNILSPGDSIWMPIWVTLILIIWLWVVILVAAYQVVRYRIDIRKLLAKSEKASVEIDGKNVELFLNKNIQTPYTVGFIRPTIVMPVNSLSHPCFLMIYKHEEMHKKNYDSLMKLLCVIIICIHCINPTVILLLFLYNVTAEYVCDDYAGKECTDEEKKKYLLMLIHLSSIDEPLSMVWRNNLADSDKLIKRRIDYMMKKTKTGVLRRGIAVAASVVTVLASSSTIFAYEPFMSSDESSIEAFEGGDVGTFLSDGNVDDIKFIDSDNIFVYEDGTQVAVTDQISPNALCNHTMTTGYYHIHKPKSSGGCTIEVYNAQKCTKCGYLKLGSLYSTTTYTVCPH